MKQKIRDNKKTIATASAAILLLIAISPLIADFLLVEKQKLTFNATADVSPDHNNSTQLGVAAGSEGLDYGEISSGSNISRFILLDAPVKTYFDLQAKGNISPHLEYEPKMVFQGRKNVTVEFKPPEPGNYSGKLVINARYPNGGLGERWMQLKR
jgi:hypothetical protein